MAGQRRLFTRVALLAAACWAAAGVRAGERDTYARLRFAAGTFAARHPLSEVANQTWRRFVPSWLVTTALNVSSVTALRDPPWPHSPLETWWAVPTHRMGDQRNGIAVRLGNATDDAYDWVLYGDDDTIFLVDNALEMLRGLDPALPYYLGDAIGGIGTGTVDKCMELRKPPLGHFCALPGTAESTGTRPDGSTCVMHPAVAPCVRSLFEPPNGTACSTTRVMLWGGTGFIFSRGMVHAITPELWHTVEVRRGHGDIAMAGMMWAAGFAPTNPSFMPRSAVHNSSLRNARTVVDGKALCRFGNGNGDSGFRKVWDAARRVIAGNKCDDNCQHLLFNRVGLHLEMRNAHTDPAALLRLTNDVRQMYMDYELAKRLLRNTITQQSPPAATTLRARNT